MYTLEFLTGLVVHNPSAHAGYGVFLFALSIPPRPNRLLRWRLIVLADRRRRMCFLLEFLLVGNAGPVHVGLFQTAESIQIRNGDESHGSAPCCMRDSRNQ